MAIILAAPKFCTFLGPLLVDCLRRAVGSKRCVVIMFSLSAVLNLVSPSIARVSPYFLMPVLTVIGLSRNTGQVIMAEIIAWWFPVSERMFASSFAMAGMNTAAILGSLYSGYACSIPVDNGWPFIFYIITGAMVIFIILWGILCTSSPDTHPFITKEELQFIIINRSGMEEDGRKKSSMPPYRQIFCSKAVLGYLTLCSCYLWVMTSTMSYIQIFYKTTLKFSTSEVGLMMSLIAVVRILCGLAWVGFSRILILSARGLPINHVRKITVMIGLSVSAGLHFTVSGTLSYANPWVIYAMHLGVHGFDCVVHNMFGVLALDMAPRYASTIIAIQGTLSTTISTSGPLFVGFMTPEYSTHQWATVFVIWGAVILAGGTLFCLLGEAVLQPWAQQPNKTWR